jgi:ElaA protein
MYDIKQYNELSTDEFHDVISLRMEVFGVEQEAIYNDLDGYDKYCHHLVVSSSDTKVIGTARILAPDLKYPEVSFGRIVVDQSFRKQGIGHTIVKMIIDFIDAEYPDTPIKISAMKYLQPFYEGYDFKQASDIYLDCGIEHIDMVRQPKKPIY